ncbi:DUF5406 family protein [Citrobacter sp. S-77]|uniref:DUF5406 family protein n=1 Tax=Citrobacter sp. S-77 TaxID=1080067 RepID=UPI000A8F6904|nr:DUF5406 family protein [Citrobacter sp. S-77]
MKTSNISNDSQTIMNYDPNMTMCGRLAKQTVRLTFGQWEYRETFEVTVGGNLTGLDVINCAVENLYESLPYEEILNVDTGEIDIVATIQIGKLECMDEDVLGEAWLAEMLIAAEIINIEPDGKLA